MLSPGRKWASIGTTKKAKAPKGYATCNGVALSTNRDELAKACGKCLMATRMGSV